MLFRSDLRVNESDCSGNGHDLSNHGVTFNSTGGNFVSAELDYLTTADTSFIDFGFGDFTYCVNITFRELETSAIISYFDNNNDQGWGLRYANIGDYSIQPKIANNFISYTLQVETTGIPQLFCARRNNSVRSE